MPREAPRGPRPTGRAESGPISAVVFFFFSQPTYLRRAVFLFLRTRPHAAQPRREEHGAPALPRGLQATARLALGLQQARVLQPPCGSTLASEETRTPLQHQAGLGRKHPTSACKAESWTPSAARWPTVSGQSCTPVRRAPTFEKGEGFGRSQRSASPISPPTFLWGKLTGAGHGQDPTAGDQ